MANYKFLYLYCSQLATQVTLNSACTYLQNCRATPALGQYQIILLYTKVCVIKLRRVVRWQWNGWESNQRPWIASPTVWLNGNALGLINKVVLPGRVTVLKYRKKPYLISRFSRHDKLQPTTVNGRNRIQSSSSRMRVMNQLVSHETTSSSAECSRDKPPFSFVRGQHSTMWDIVWVSPQGHRSCL